MLGVSKHLTKTYLTPTYNLTFEVRSKLPLSEVIGRCLKTPTYAETPLNTGIPEDLG